MRYLLAQGYRVIPVRPLVKDVLGVPCVASLAEIEEPIHIVDVFRRAEFCPQIAHEAAAVGAQALWLQHGILSPEARAIAEAPAWNTSSGSGTPRRRGRRSCHP